MRSALGGSRWRIVRQLLTEHVLLASLGGLAGIPLGWAGVRVAPFVMPPGTLPESVGLAFDGRVLLAAVVLIFGVTPLDTATFMAAPLILALTAVAASVAPAVRASRVDAAVALRQE